ncbi:MAG TPA: CofH family radical SAM protein [Bacteroidales bacterium]|nr:CofH family radical SAM protein [Bacteroidales bacterium]
MIIHYLYGLMHSRELLFDKALNLESLSVEEALFLYHNSSIPELMNIAFSLRKIHIPGDFVGWQIDRNVNITNICFSQCSFCNFCRKPKDPDTYITSFEEYEVKIGELFEMGGDQLLLQGGMHPELGLDYYTDLFKGLKQRFPELKLHALGPPEIVHLARKESLTYGIVLKKLAEAGLDSLPGAGAEILSDRVRKIVSPAKATSREWLDVMRIAHKMNLPTSATMMFGHIETIEERLQHLALIREVQSEKPEGNNGFISFIPWPFQDKGTRLAEKQGVRNSVNMIEYIRMVALSRIMLPNIVNLQSSILTTGKDTAIMTLYGGANDLGSVMIEENVVSAAGSSNMFNAEQLPMIIREAGFTPRLRNQKYEPL